ncbi:aminoglycoside phosphotransferase (APT) family kinase protein [Motilibacter peucedani]|uniref:Aminoglycoside phosphotransferase (APT) family kinase protein n=1 Tax=Motilibacter peucedani TaxID=598650 RepID=A0A420XU80_9ACTN|nr:aminoglycoside phosphotransferase family protein [Motilibacter peucedani]RKS80422.1 aminoglycoside phosphotransferase (APT) family kinase protein [Motilibacter peucedani]
MPAPGRMHADEVDTDEALVARLVAAQHPQWAALPVTHLSSAGTDNAIYRLGTDLVARLPRIASVSQGIAHEWQWLRHLAPLLPVDVPEPVALGEPGDGYPFPWSVCRYVAGDNPGPATTGPALVDDLTSFLRHFHGLDPAAAPLRSRVRLADRDDQVLSCIDEVADLVDAPEVAAAWAVLRDTPPAELPGPWVHGDITAGNLLVRGGRLSGVLDFSGVGRGDPATDLGVAWNLLTPPLRARLRRQLQVDEETWRRSAGWSLSQALIQLPYYRETNLPLAANARHVIAETVPWALAL